MSDALRHDGSIDPHLFGPLEELAQQGEGRGRAPAGETRLGSSADVLEQQKILERVRPALDLLLDEDERIACVCEGHQRPTFSELWGLGWFYVPLHKVVLVVTNVRMIEVLMDLRGTGPTTRIRSFSWGAATGLSLKLSMLTLKTGGSSYSWRVSGSRVRRLLAVLVPRLQLLLLETTGYVAAADACHWHCPACGRGLPPVPKACDRCGTRFRTPGMAGGLAWAFPGAGLIYAGRPVFATAVLVGELLMFVVLAGVLSIGLDLGNAFLIGMVPSFLIVSKYQSARISEILVRRTIPVRIPAARNWMRFAVVGGIVSVAAFVGATQLIGTGLRTEPPAASAPAAAAFDLDFSTVGEEWFSTRNVADFALVDDGRQRSEWSNGTLSVFVLRDPPPPSGRWQDFRDDLLALYPPRGLEPVVDDNPLPLGLEGMLFRVHYPGEDDPYVEYYAIVWDESDRTIHSVVMYVSASEAAEGRASLDRLLSHARFIEAIEPAR